MPSFGRGVGDVQAGLGAARARHVAHDDRRIAGNVPRKMPRDRAGIDVVAAADIVADDEVDGLAGVEILRGRGRRGERSCGGRDQIGQVRLAASKPPLGPDRRARRLHDVLRRRVQLLHDLLHLRARSGEMSMRSLSASARNCSSFMVASKALRRMRERRGRDFRRRDVGALEHLLADHQLDDRAVERRS